MPILRHQPDIYPSNLLLVDSPGDEWWVLYALARQEKKLMRRLLDEEIAYYGPTIEKRYRAPNGRLRSSYIPLFTNYVFIRGSDEERHRAVSTGSVSRWMRVPHVSELTADLRQIQELIATGAPLIPEQRLETGHRVRVRNGVFRGFEGEVIRRENQIRLLVFVRYMGQGASVALDDCQLEPI